MTIARQDFAFPFRIDPASQQTAQIDYATHVEQMVCQLLLTSPGERVNLPQFGCGLRSLVFAPNSDALAATVQLRVIQGLNQWLAGVVNVVDVTAGDWLGRDSPRTRHPRGHGHLHPRRNPDEPGRDGGGRMSTPEPQARDRRQLLLAPGAVLNGIDYVDVAAGQSRLSVHFLNTVTLKGSLSGSRPVTITGGEVVTSVSVSPIDETTDWSADSQGRPVLALTVTAPWDFSTYRLTISSGKLDPFFDQAPFSFTVNGPTMPDPAVPAPSCPEPAQEQVPIDYLAKDFASFQQALSEFSAQRYPAWVERSEADLGVMLMEVLAAMADELSYYQDRVLAESAIETATQRLSVVRHARLVDYEPAPATVATAILQLDVAGPPASSPPATGWTIDMREPLLIRALGADGSVVDFEIEDPAVGLAGAVSTAPPAWATVDTRWNRAGSPLPPYYWDDSQRCLLAGSTDFYVVGHELGLYAGQQLLLDSPAADSADPPVRELVTVSATEETYDPLIGNPPPTPLTRIFLQAATTDDHDLNSTAVAGNIVPAVQGLRQSETFMIPDPTAPSPGPVVVRVGANWTPQDPLPDYRYCLASSPLAWLATTSQDDSLPALPEIVLSEVLAGGGTSPWMFQHWLLDAGAADQVFTLTPEQYSPVLTSNGTSWFDYDGDGGTTIRFGDGTFADVPAARYGLQRALPRGRRLGRQRPRGRDRKRRAGVGAGIAHQRLHQPLPGHGRRGRRDRRAGTRPCAAEVQRGAAPRGQCRGLRGGSAVAPMGTAGGHRVPLDGKLAHRSHPRRPGRD